MGFLKQEVFHAFGSRKPKTAGKPQNRPNQVLLGEPVSS
jgi:hypothetical protein